MYTKTNSMNTTNVDYYIINHQPNVINFNITIDDTISILDQPYPLHNVQVLLYIGGKQVLSAEVSEYINKFPYTGTLKFTIPKGLSDFKQSALTFSIQCWITNTIGQSQYVNLGSINSKCINNVHYMTQFGTFQNGIMRVYHKGKWVCGKV